MRPTSGAAESDGLTLGDDHELPALAEPPLQQLARVLPTSGGYGFAASLAEVSRLAGPPGVVNLHRLARLYSDPAGRPSAERAAILAADLGVLKMRGWQLVWTVHNLLPIFRTSHRHPVDLLVAADVLDKADAVITHTHADAQSVLQLYQGGPVVASGSAGFDAIPAEPASDQVQRLISYLTTETASLLMLGNMAPYKGLPCVVRIFLDSIRSARLVIAGRPADQETAARLTRLANRSGGRVLVHPEHIPPGNARLLCQAADALIAPYRTDGPFAIFRHVLHPSSVSMATGFGMPVVAPDLPSIRELTRGHTTALYEGAEQAAGLLARMDSGSYPWGRVGSHPGPRNRWTAVAAVYRQLAAEMAMRGAPGEASVTQASP